MINAIKELGQQLKNIPEISIFIDKPFKQVKDNEKIIFIVFKFIKNKLSFNKITVENYKSNLNHKYLYCRGSAGGSNITPVAKTTDKPLSTTLKNRLINAIINIYSEQNFIEKYTNETDKTLLNKLIFFFNDESNLNKIISAIKEELKNISEDFFISIKIIDNDTEKYIGDYNIFNEYIIYKKKNDFYYQKTGNINSRAREKDCSICRNKKKEVFGLVKTFPFYNLDKPGFVAGGFNPHNSWKNYPVCIDCAINLLKGKKYLQENLNFKFYGFNYFLIPKFIFDEPYNFFNLIKELKNPSFRKKDKIRISDAEEEILYELSSEKNYLYFNFLFYEEAQSGAVFNILLNIQDVLPSRIKYLFITKDEIDKLSIFENHNITFSFKIVRDIFPYEGKHSQNKKYFLEIINKIISNISIDYEFIINSSIKLIRKAFTNNKATIFLSLETYMLLIYLNKLKILKRRNYMETKEHISNDDIYGKFFNENKEFFQNYQIQAIFLIGVLTKFLLDIQYRERHAQPFKSKLFGLKLNESKVKRIFVEVQNKLEEYDENYYSALENIISNLLVKAGNSWKLTNNEISFYFTLGLDLAENFKNKKEEENNE